jgi:hypothetical protein
MLSCRPVIEAITEYLEGELGFLRRLGFLIHIRTCWQCRQYLAQVRAVIESVALLPLEAPAPEAMERLRLGFAGWDAAPPPPEGEPPPG